MVSYARCQTAGAEGAADIDIKAGFDKEGAKLADVDRFFNGGRKNQAIGAGKRVHTY